MKKMLKTMCSDLVKRLGSDRARLALLIIYIAFTVVTSVIGFSRGSVRNGILPLAYAALFLTVLSVAESFCGMRCGKLFLIIVFSVPIGGILGSCFNFYNLIPFFDTLLHTISGFIFCGLGYFIMIRVLRSSDKRSRLAAALFAIAFSLALAVLWELFEWALTVLMNGDMQEDSLVTDIRSYFLAGSHNVPKELLDIEKTVVYYDGGKVYVIEGGYLDLGVLDTLTDMLVCFIGALVFEALCIVDLLENTRLIRYFTPACEDINEL